MFAYDPKANIQTFQILTLIKFTIVNNGLAFAHWHTETIICLRNARLSPCNRKTIAHHTSR
jgi:hypothetical protein